MTDNLYAVLGRMLIAYRQTHWFWITCTTMGCFSFHFDQMMHVSSPRIFQWTLSEVLDITNVRTYQQMNKVISPKINTIPKIAEIGTKQLSLLSSSLGWSGDPSGCDWITGAEKKYMDSFVHSKIWWNCNMRGASQFLTLDKCIFSYLLIMTYSMLNARLPDIHFR